MVQADSEDIVILYENDVHCAIEGYAKLAAMKQELSQTHDHVGVVSVGDYVQGSSLGAISRGEYIIRTMNLVGYDAVALGNHEFDYKLPRLQELVTMMDTKPTCCNFAKVDAGEPMFKPYTMVTYGQIHIAYIGITTPDTITSSSPLQFMNDQGEHIYTFHGSDLYATVQSTIDAAKAAGADYIIGLSHLGTEDVYEQWSAQSVVQNTSGLDVVLDGHSHSVVESMTVNDQNGEAVVISSTGTKFQYIGKLTISDGNITTDLVEVESYQNTHQAVSDYVAQVQAEYSVLGDRVIGDSTVDLTTVDENGERLIRKQETNLGDFCADAYRVVLGADIGLQNGGGIRADMAAGEITFNDILSVFPFNNTVCVVEATGQQIINMLELGVVNYPNEDGTFQQVSGITFTLDDTIPSSVVLDENLMFVAVEGSRRVKDVKVLDRERGEYLPIDLTKTYTVASHSYLLLEQGGGASMFRDAKVVKNDGMLDVELLEMYITEHLNGTIGTEYADWQGRIVLASAQGQMQPTPSIPETGHEESMIICYGLVALSAGWYVWNRKRIG